MSFQKQQRNNAPPQTQPQQNDIVTFSIKLPRYYYNLFSQFANFLHSQPMLDQKGQPVFKIDMKTGKPILGQDGKPQIRTVLESSDIQTYFVTCAFQTYEGYKMVMEGLRQQQAQAQQQK